MVVIESEDTEPGILKEFACYVMTKEVTTKFGTCTLYVLVGPKLHVAVKTLLKIMFVTPAVGPQLEPSTTV